MLKPMTTELIPRASVESLCLAFQTTAETVRRCQADMLKANDHLGAVWGELIDKDGHRHGQISMLALTAEQVEKTILDSKRAAWSRIIEHCGFRSLMSVKQQEELDRQLWGNERGNSYRDGGDDGLPDLTPDTVYGWLDVLSKNLPDMFTEACREIFKLCTPQKERDSYKTNEPCRELVGRKVILGWTVEAGYDGGLRLRYNSKESQIRALGNVFSLLDGKGPQQRPGDLVTKLNEAWHKSREPYQDEYFRIKGYAGTGTMHIEFLRLDLVKELNKRAAGMNLSAA